MKGYVSYDRNESIGLAMGGWEHTGGHVDGFLSEGVFDACVPLRMWLGFAKDYRQIIINARQELVLLLANSNHNSLISTGPVEHNPKLTISRVIWKVRHISVSDAERVKLLNYLQ